MAAQCEGYGREAGSDQLVRCRRDATWGRYCYFCQKVAEGLMPDAKWDPKVDPPDPPSAAEILEREWD